MAGPKDPAIRYKIYLQSMQYLSNEQIILQAFKESPRCCNPAYGWGCYFYLILTSRSFISFKKIITPDNQVCQNCLATFIYPDASIRKLQAQQETLEKDLEQHTRIPQSYLLLKAEETVSAFRRVKFVYGHAGRALTAHCWANHLRNLSDLRKVRELLRSWTPLDEILPKLDYYFWREYLGAFSALFPGRRYLRILFSYLSPVPHPRPSPPRVSHIECHTERDTDPHTKPQSEPEPEPQPDPEEYPEPRSPWKSCLFHITYIIPSFYILRLLLASQYTAKRRRPPPRSRRRSCASVSNPRAQPSILSENLSRFAVSVRQSARPITFPQ